MEVKKRAIDFMRKEKPKMIEAWKIESETSPEYKAMISALKEMTIKEIVETQKIALRKQTREQKMLPFSILKKIHTI